jgi:hypothetical protein
LLHHNRLFDISDRRTFDISRSVVAYPSQPFVQDQWQEGTYFAGTEAPIVAAEFSRGICKPASDILDENTNVELERMKWYAYFPVLRKNMKVAPNVEDTFHGRY